MNHSPAPWHIEDGFGPIAVQDAEGRRVADLSGSRDVVNAQLIKSAPALRETLQAIMELVDWEEHEMENVEAVKRARVLLAELE